MLLWAEESKTFEDAAIVAGGFLISTRILTEIFPGISS